MRDKPCATLSVEEHLYEAFTLGVALALSVGYLILSLKQIWSTEPVIKADSAVEFFLGVIAVYVALPLHEFFHGLAITVAKGRPAFTLGRILTYVPIPVVEDASEKPLSRSEFRTVLLFPIALPLLSAVGLFLLNGLDYPLFILSIFSTAYSSWDIFLLLKTRNLKAAVTYHGPRVGLRGDCEALLPALERVNAAYSIVKHWAGWTWFYFFIEFFMFLLVQLGAVGFREGFTLRVGPILVFSVEPWGEGFKTVFNALGAYVLAALLAIPSAYLSSRIVEAVS